ncbi:MAG: hypothetical protein A3J37_08910 [Alphaproteobacteria bacterium RIFCSPHIGHO2_12_FULL_45_9]|nr:MAG: hypothetical protein A3B66_01820 [Alphaproteobacteria bacterium RIFCSPHIGHO2_02_FULL_46_13]OFW98645.1 MAG: hypothetical protein A3J37_08910 [Alphaproteobacteria bacterium RIFCSPHIGHO2_12_FULL_45_9]
MSLAQSLSKATYAVPLVFAVAAGAASAQNKLPVIEPSATDLSRPLAAACVETTPGQPALTAWDKLKTIMSARGQMIVGSGDKIVQGNQRREVTFTISNNFSGKEGYIIDSAANKAGRDTSNGFCFEPLVNAVFLDVSKLDKVPAVLNKGELGIALTNAHKLGSKVAFMGMAQGGSLYAVHFNPNSSNHKGSLIGANAQGGQAANLAVFENFDYSDKMKVVMEQLSSNKIDQRVAGLDARRLDLK